MRFLATRSLLLSAALLTIPIPSARPDEFPRVPHGKAGTEAKEVTFRHLKLRVGVRLLYGEALLSDPYPYLDGELPGEPKPVHVTPETAARVFEPITTKEAAREFVGLFHAGIPIESKEEYEAAVAVAAARGEKPEHAGAPDSYGLQIDDRSPGRLRVRVLLYETHSCVYGVREYAYEIGADAVKSEPEISWVRGPVVSWQTCGPVDEKAEAEARRKAGEFDQAMRDAVKTGAGARQ